MYEAKKNLANEAKLEELILEILREAQESHEIDWDNRSGLTDAEAAVVRRFQAKPPRNLPNEEDGVKFLLELPSAGARTEKEMGIGKKAARSASRSRLCHRQDRAILYIALLITS